MLEQGFLFGNPDVVDDALAGRELRLLALNLQSPGAKRVAAQLNWIYRTGCNVLVLTEVKAGDAAVLLVKDLESSGFTVTWSEPRQSAEDRNHTIVASKGYSVIPLTLPLDSPRLVGARIASHLGPLDIVGLYSLTNGMTADSSRQRAGFQAAVVEALSVGDRSVPLLVAGDLNVLPDEPSPARSLFAEHDFAFYRSFSERLGLTDTYRFRQPNGRDQTWYGPSGGQRLDHALLSHAVIDRVTECAIDHGPRQEKISDHAALRLTLV
jgi:exodeoxyribonuclease-3